MTGNGMLMWDEWFINSYRDNAAYSQVMCDDKDIFMHLLHAPSDSSSIDSSMPKFDM